MKKIIVKTLEILSVALGFFCALGFGVALYVAVEITIDALIISGLIGGVIGSVVSYINVIRCHDLYNYLVESEVEA